MKILNLLTFYHTLMIFYDLSQALGARGHCVKTFNAVAHGTVVDQKYLPILTEDVVQKECYTDFDRFLFLYKQAKIIKAAEKSYNVADFDIIHAHTLFNAGYAAYKLNKKYAVPYVVTVRSTDINSFLKVPGFAIIAKKVLKNASSVLFLSEPAKKRIVEQCVSPKDRMDFEAKTAIFYNGLEQFWLDNIVSTPKSHAGKEVTLLCVGKISKIKNNTILLEAMDQLERRGYRPKLKVIGQVLDHEMYDRLKADGRVEFFEYMSKEDLIKQYRASDIFVLPSVFETFGRVYAEAMTQGLPVLYTKGQGFDGIFPDGSVGYAIDAKDGAHIADCVIKVLQNYAGISKNCVEKCRIFDWKTISAGIEAIYDRATAGECK